MDYLELAHNDIELFADDIRAWQVDFKQLGKAPFKSLLRQRRALEILVTNASFSTQLEQRGGAPPGFYTFAFLHPASPKIIFKGKDFADHIAVYRPGSEIDAFSPSGFSVYTLSISANEVDQWKEMLGVSHPAAAHFACSDLLRVEKMTLFRLRNKAEQFLSLYDSPLQLQRVKENLVVDLLETLWQALPFREKPSATVRFSSFKRLIAYIDRKMSEPVSLMDLCRVEKISPRTVQRLFLKYAGCTPKNYMRARRLNNAKDDLAKKSSANASVSDIANNWGFWHMGQFAKDYKMMFGELPSATLARQRLPRQKDQYCAPS